MSSHAAMLGPSAAAGQALKVYSRTFLNTELAEVLVKVVVKVLKIISIATKEVEKGRASESLLLFRGISF